MTFATELAKMPFTPTGTNATGFTAPLMRASGHALFVVIGAAVGTEVVTEDEILT